MHADALPQRVDAAIGAALAEQRLVGAVVLVARDGEMVHRGIAGFADREAGHAMREDAIFRFASLTKPIVSAAAMALIEAGRLRLDDRLDRWLPEFRPRLADGAEAGITLRQLLTHTAGLSYGFFQPADGPYARRGVSDGMDQPGLPMAEELSRLASLPLGYVPGSAWGYSLALDVLGEVLARAADATLAEIVEQKVARPLGLRDTGFAVRDPARLAAAYVDGRPPRRMQDPDIVPFGDGAGIKFSPSRVFDSASFASGGTGLAGTAGDLLIFLEAIRSGGGAILTPQSAGAMMSNQIGALRITTETTPSWGFGFGGAVLMDRELAGTPQANGTWKWGGVYGHHWYVDPVNRLTVVALTNTAIEGMAGGFVAELRSAVYGG
jgi:CubicO group peptidase (beta-lactamase class C family)